MDLLVARRPILTRRRTVYGYELRFRDGLDSYAEVISRGDGNLAARDALLTMITGGAKALVSLSTEALLAGEARRFPAASLVVDLAADTPADGAVIVACRELKARGGRISMSDRILESARPGLLPLLDFLRSDHVPDDIEHCGLPYVAASHPVAFIADHVERELDFVAAAAAGYTYVEGFFFAHPDAAAEPDPDNMPLNHLAVLQEARRPEINFNKLEAVISRESSLTHKLLQHVNSASFGLRNRVVGIKHALLIMGEAQVRRFLSLMVLGDASGERSPELIRMAAARGSFCEAIARELEWPDRGEELFQLGSFSLLDAVVGLPLATVLEDVTLPLEVVDALLGRECPYRVIYDLMIACERADWCSVDLCAATLGLPLSAIARASFRSMEWTHTVLG